MRSSTAPLLLLLGVPALPAPEFQPDLWTTGAVAGPRSPWLQPLAGLMDEIFQDPVSEAVRLRQTAGERAVVDWLAGLQADQVRDQLTAQWERLPTESRQNLAEMVGLLQEKLQQGWDAATTDNFKHTAQLLLQYLDLAFTKLLKMETFMELLVQNLASLPQETVEELLGLVPWSEITDVVYNFDKMTFLDLRELVVALQPLYNRLVELYSLQDLQDLLQQAAAGQTKQAEAALLVSAGGALQTLQELSALVPWQQVFFMLKNYEDSTISDQLQLVSAFQPLYQHLTVILASDELMMFLQQFLASSAEVESLDGGSGDGGGELSLVEFLTELNALVPWQQISLTWQGYPSITMSDLQELALQFLPLNERIAEFLTPQNLRLMFSLEQVGRMETVKTAEAALLLRAGGVLQTAMELNALVPWQLIFSSLENYENNTISDLQQLALAFKPLYERLTEFTMQELMIFLEHFIVSSEEVMKLDDGIVDGTAEANVVEMVTELSELIPWQLISQTFENYPEVSLSELNQLALAFKPLYAHIGLELEKVERGSGDGSGDGETLSEIVVELYSLVPWQQISLIPSFSSITTADLRQLLAAFKPLFDRLTELFTLQDLQAILQHISFRLKDKEDEVVEAMDKMEEMEVASNGGLLTGLTSFLSSSFGRKSEDQFCRPARLVCYYPNWAAHREGEGKFTVADIDSSLCTHIIYSFVVLHPDRLIITSDDPQLDLELGNFRNFTALKRTNPGVKYMVALGGWADSQDPKYSRLLASSVHMDTFVAHAVQFLQEFGFDGLDLDYEYPGYDGHGHDAPDSDRPGLVQLCRKLRAAFRPHGWELTAAVAAPTSIVDTAYDIPQLSQLLDAVHLMAYDMHGSWERATNHHAALYGSAWDKLTAEAAAAHWVAKGCPAYKLVVGIPTYGRSWTLASWAPHQGVEAPAAGAGQAGPITRAEGYLAYSEICHFIRNQGWTVVQDPTNHIGPIAYSGDQWVGYDDPAMSAVKAGWAVEHQYGGTMFWDLPSDDFRGDCGAGRSPVIRAAADLVLGQQVCS